MRHLSRLLKGFIGTIEYDYPDFHLSMDCFWCEIISGQLTLKEAKEARWLTWDMLDSVPWLPADIVLIEKIMAASAPANRWQALRTSAPVNSRKSCW